MKTMIALEYILNKDEMTMAGFLCVWRRGMEDSFGGEDVGNGRGIYAFLPCTVHNQKCPVK